MKILICSYKALDCLKIQCEILKKLNVLNDTIIYENSPKEWIYNREYLKINNIPFRDNPNSTHPSAIDLAFKEIEDDNLIILDQDCFPKINPIKFFEDMLHYFPMMDLCGDINLCRGSQKLYPRICPWYCFVNLKFVREHNIKFVNEEKVLNSDSEIYYNPWKEIMGKPNVSTYKYDVGSTFFEDMYNSGAYITSLSDLNVEPSKLYNHIEGSSWQLSNEYINIYGNFYKQSKEPIIKAYKEMLGIE